MKKKIAVLVASALLSGVLCVTAFAADADDLTGPGDPTGIMDRSRWGTT